MKLKIILIAVLTTAFLSTSCVNDFDAASTAMSSEITIDAVVDGQVQAKAAETTIANLSEYNLLMSVGTADYSDGVITCSATAPMSTVYYWPSNDVTFRAVGAPKDWAVVTSAGVTAVGFNAGLADTPDPVIAATTSGKVPSVPLTFYHTLSRVSLHYAGTEYENIESKGIYIVPKSHHFIADIRGDFEYDGTMIAGKWASSGTGLLTADAWKNQVEGDAATFTYDPALAGDASGDKPTNDSRDNWVNVIPGRYATAVAVTIDVVNAADNSVIVKDKHIVVTLPNLGAVPGAPEAGLTGGRYQPGYGYIYDLQFYVKKSTGPGTGTDQDYDIEPIVIQTVAVNPWTDQLAGTVVYGK